MENEMEAGAFTGAYSDNCHILVLDPVYHYSIGYRKEASRWYWQLFRPHVSFQSKDPWLVPQVSRLHITATLIIQT